jgi:hypothetical protein
MVHTILGRGKGHWKAALAAFIAMPLLLPLPAFALTWLNDWHIKQTQTGGAPSAQVSSGDFQNGGFLTIDMGGYLTTGKTSSKVTATRDFKANSTAEALQVAESFQTWLHNDKLTVTVQAKPVGGGHTLNFPSVNENASGLSNYRFVDYSNTTTKNLSKGKTYELIVTISYHKNRFGRGGYIDVSPFSFTFTGV